MHRRRGCPNATGQEAQKLGKFASHSSGSRKAKAKEPRAASSPPSPCNLPWREGSGALPEFCLQGTDATHESPPQGHTSKYPGTRG